MRNVFEYKGYYTIVQYESDSLTIMGKIEGIDDLVTFECQDPKAIEEEFHKAVNNYLVFCREVGKEPNQEYNEQLNVSYVTTI